MIRELLDRVLGLGRVAGLRRPVPPLGFRPDDRQPWGPGTGRASYAVVQRRRAANRRARAARRITRRRSR